MIKLYNGGAYLLNGTELVEQHPVSKEEAEKIKKEIEEAGGVVKIA